MTPEEKYRRILGNHLPPEAVDWVYNFLFLHKVHFHITRERRTKLGDYRWPQANHSFHEISVNGDLNPYRFLWVFIHEAAHLETHLRYTNVQAHGHEWQTEFARLLKGCLSLFPPEAQPFIVKYTSSIPLKRPIDKQIEEILHRYDPDYNPDERSLHLDDLQAGTRFCLKAQPEKIFLAEERRRTRWLCQEIGSGRRYLVNGSAEVIVR